MATGEQWKKNIPQRCQEVTERTELASNTLHIVVSSSLTEQLRLSLILGQLWAKPFSLDKVRQSLQRCPQGFKNRPEAVFHSINILPLPNRLLFHICLVALAPYKGGDQDGKTCFIVLVLFCFLFLVITPLPT